MRERNKQILLQKHEKGCSRDYENADEREEVTASVSKILHDELDKLERLKY